MSLENKMDWSKIISKTLEIINLREVVAFSIRRNLILIIKITKTIKTRLKRSKHLKKIISKKLMKKILFHTMMMNKIWIKSNNSENLEKNQNIFSKKKSLDNHQRSPLNIRKEGNRKRISQMNLLKIPQKLFR